MIQKHNIAVIVGSLRQASYSRKVARALESFSGDHLDLNLVEIGDLAHYNEDLETLTPPESWVRFRQQLHEAVGVIFVTPEYNRALPSSIKNAVDVGSRPYGKGIWAHKVGGIITVSQGALGGFGANHQLRQALVFPGVITMPQPEAYIGHVQNFITDDARPATPEAKHFLENFMSVYQDFVQRLVR